MTMRLGGRDGGRIYRQSTFKFVSWTDGERGAPAMVSLFVGVTDYSWFEFLRRQPDLAEVNFWQPSGHKAFRALQAGELFLFKLHSPRNFIVGGGVFSHATNLPLSLAWEAFGAANGAESLQAMRARIAKYRRDAPDPKSDY